MVIEQEGDGKFGVRLEKDEIGILTGILYWTIVIGLFGVVGVVSMWLHSAWPLLLLGASIYVPKLNDWAARRGPVEEKLRKASRLQREVTR